MAISLRILRTSSREEPDLLQSKMVELEAAGFKILYDDLPPNAHWRTTAASPQVRAAALAKAIEERESTAILSARGGYGASDLFSYLPWAAFEKLRPKLIAGFSDVTALHAAFFTRLGWPGIHGPMPASSLWGKDGERTDIDTLMKILRGELSSGNLAIQKWSPTSPEPITGWLFGGCFTVLTNLIGTPYFPKSLAGAVIYLEDTGENPGRLMRNWNQWVQSGVLAGVRALVLGHFRDCGDGSAATMAEVVNEFATRSALPTYTSLYFGHVSPNTPIGFGCPARIEDNTLHWTLPNSGKEISS